MDPGLLVSNLSRRALGLALCLALCLGAAPGCARGEVGERAGELEDPADQAGGVVDQERAAVPGGGAVGTLERGGAGRVDEDQAAEVNLDQVGLAGLGKPAQ